MAPTSTAKNWPLNSAEVLNDGDLLHLGELLIQVKIQPS